MGTGKDRPGADPAELEKLAKRFQDLWQEQLAATASDPEFVEMMGKWMGAMAAGGMRLPAMPPGGAAGPVDAATWMATMQRALAGAEGKDRVDDARAGARAPKAGPKAAAAASGAGHVERDELERRLADLEHRVGRLEAGLGGARKGTSAGSRRRKS